MEWLKSHSKVLTWDQAVIRLFFTLEAGVRCQVNPCENYCVETGTGDRFIHGAIRFSTVTIIPPLLHSHLHVHVGRSRKKYGEACQPSKKQRSCRNQGALHR